MIEGGGAAGAGAAVLGSVVGKGSVVAMSRSST